MLRSLLSLRKSVIEATDGEIGTVEDFLFDDEHWTVRYLVVNTGSWLMGRKVLVSPISIQGADAPMRVIRVSLTRDQVEKSPDIDTDKPVSRQVEARFHDYNRWPYYWGGVDAWGTSAYPAGMLGQLYMMQPPSPPSLPEPAAELGDQHLRSAHAVRRYGIEATDHHFGHVADFVIDDETWGVRYIVIDTINFWPGKSVILSPQWVDSIRWSDRVFSIKLTREKIKNSPEYHADAPINREYEERLYDYYGRSKYWEQAPPPGLGKTGIARGRLGL